MMPLLHSVYLLEHRGWVLPPLLLLLQDSDAALPMMYMPDCLEVGHTLSGDGNTALVYVCCVCVAIMCVLLMAYLCSSNA
jgi:hypothetical protein